MIGKPRRLRHREPQPADFDEARVVPQVLEIRLGIGLHADRRRRDARAAGFGAVRQLAHQVEQRRTEIGERNRLHGQSVQLFLHRRLLLRANQDEVLAARAREGFSHPPDLALDGVFHAEPDEQKATRGQHLAKCEERCLVVRLHASVRRVEQVVAVRSQDDVFGAINGTVQVPNGGIGVPVDIGETGAIRYRPLARAVWMRIRPVQHLVVVRGDDERAAKPPDGARQFQAWRMRALERRVELFTHKAEPERTECVAAFLRGFEQTAFPDQRGYQIGVIVLVLVAQPLCRLQQEAGPAREDRCAGWIGDTE